MNSGDQCRRAKLLLAAVLLSLAAFSCSGWADVDDFVATLHCGMSVTDVASRSRAHGATQFVADERLPLLYGTHVAAAGTSRVYLGFVEGELRWYRRGEQAGPWTGMRIGAKHDLCTGSTIVSLVIHGSSRWNGARVFVDGRLVGALGGAHVSVVEVDVPLGMHEIVVKNEQQTAMRKVSTDGARGIEQVDFAQPPRKRNFERRSTL